MRHSSNQFLQIKSTSKTLLEWAMGESTLLSSWESSKLFLQCMKIKETKPNSILSNTKVTLPNLSSVKVTTTIGSTINPSSNQYEYPWPMKNGKQQTIWSDKEKTQGLNAKKKRRIKRKWGVVASVEFTNGKLLSIWCQCWWLLVGSYLFACTHSENNS